MSRMALDVDLELDTTTKTENGDHDKFAHYVDKDDATASMVQGTPIIALCGKIWVPTRAPDSFPVCPTCKEIYDALFKS
jgi:hypothetical protein